MLPRDRQPTRHFGPVEIADRRELGIHQADASELIGIEAIFTYCAPDEAAAGGHARDIARCRAAFERHTLSMRYGVDGWQHHGGLASAMTRVCTESCSFPPKALSPCHFPVPGERSHSVYCRQRRSPVRRSGRPRFRALGRLPPGGKVRAFVDQLAGRPGDGRVRQRLGGGLLLLFVVDHPGDAESVR